MAEAVKNRALPISNSESVTDPCSVSDIIPDSDNMFKSGNKVDTGVDNYALPNLV